MSDEDVIRRRLLIDGDGTGDDRRLNVLLKTIIKWANTVREVPGENQILYDRILAQLSQCKFAEKKSRLIAKTNENQLNMYKLLQENLKDNIVTVKSNIEQNKTKLAGAKVLKQNRMMYNLLAQSINEQPARKDTNIRLDEMDAELNELKEQSKNLERKLDMRRKQFYVLVSSANQLRTMLDEDSNSMNVSLDDIINSPEPMSE